MHVRGVLSHNAVIEALRPYIVAFWGQAEDEPIPADVQPLYDTAGFGHSNVRCFVLDSSGKLLRGFNGFPGNSGDSTRYSLSQYVSYLTGEIARAGAEAPLPKEPSSLRLPDARNGVRLYIRLPGRRDSAGTPVLAALENHDEWATLAQPKTARKVEARKLSRWLSICYPSGVNEQLEPYRTVKGNLTLTPLGKDQAILSGDIQMAMSETDYEIFEGKVEALITYGAATTLRGVVDGKYWRHETRNNRWFDSRLTAAIESRPN
jgi:hypothetical protein